MKRLIICLLCLAAITGLMTGCSENVAGGTIETTNGIAVTVKDIKGQAIGAEIICYPENYDPQSDPPLPDSLMQVTDEDGLFAFKDLTPGIYNVLARKSANSTAAILMDIEVTEEKVMDSVKAVLKQTAEVSVHLENWEAEQAGYLYIPGTGIYTEIDSRLMMNGVFTLTDVPPAAYPVIQHRTTADNAGSNLLDEPLELQPAQSMVIGLFQSWENRSKVYINTGTGGADVTEDVYDFPLLVRLDESSPSSFSFSSSNADGSDLRFTKSDGLTPLPYDIERWDRPNAWAEVWVRVDTVFGNNQTQFIYMYTGRREAPAPSYESAVFDTARGFAGVWHLGETANSNPDGYRDATPNANHGTGFNMVSVVPEGAIGIAPIFNGFSSYIQIPDHPSLNFGTGDFTASAFVRADSIAYSCQIICKHSPEIMNYELQIHLDSTLSAYVEDSTHRDTLRSSELLKPLTWYQVAMSRSSGTLYLYINGRQLPKAIASSAEAGSPIDLFLGRDPEFTGQFVEYFPGIIDEVRLSSRSRSQGWMKLCYETHKPGATAVIIE